MKSKLGKIIYSIAGLGILGFVVGILILIGFNFSLPKITSLADYSPSIPSQIYSKDGVLLAEIGKEKRYIATIDEIPKRIIDAVVSAEDSGFFEHDGVELLGLFRALIVNLKKGRYAQGGSTITQQVAKSLLLSSERSISRKIKDMLLARKIEKYFTKNEILYLYLNQVYLGGGYHGIKAAFQGYFNKELSEATIAEAAMVAGLLVAPGKYSPYINPRRAKIRQGYVLKRMFETKRISQEEYEEAKAEKTQFRIRKRKGFLAAHFTDWVRQKTMTLIGEEALLNDGYQIKTTIDYELQQVAEKQIRKTLRDIDKRQGYKGPLKNLAESEIASWINEKKNKFYKEESNFFTINKDSEKVYELERDEAFEVLEDRRKNDFYSEVKNKRFYPGNNKKSTVYKTLRKSETYEGVIVSIDNYARVVYVNINGEIGVVPYEHFKWMHERNITKERNYYSYLTKPSKMLNKGDVLLFRIVNKSSRLRSLVHKPFLNNYLKKIKKERLAVLNKQRYLKLAIEQSADVEGALVSLDPFTGEVVSLVGGKNFRKSQFNRALQSKRQPGSSFKPLLYAAALESGYTPSSIIIDSPETLGGVDDGLNWKPRNYDGKFKGPITFRNSLEQSRNVTTIKIASDLGVDNILEFSNRIGFNAELDKDLSLALGSFGVTLIDIVSTYAVFPNGGKAVEPKSILSIIDRRGELVPFVEKVDKLETLESVQQEEVQEEEKELSSSGIEEEEAEEKKPNRYVDHLSGKQVYDKRLAFIMTNLLKGVVHHGTGRGTRSVSPYLGGKTGTTNNYVDAWFIGFSPRLATGVWTGFDNNETLGWGETGAKAALPVWREFMRASISKFGEIEFPVPSGIVNVRVDKDSGQPVENAQKDAFIESFVEGDTPSDQKRSQEERDNGDENSTILEEDDYYNDQ